MDYHFTLIDRETWDRDELFAYFRSTIITTTMRLDITGFLDKVKEAGIKFYPAVIHCIATVLNRHEAFRHGYDREGNVGLFSRIDPLYTVPRSDRPDLFSMQATKFTEAFPAFYEDFQRDREEAAACGRLWCRQPDGNIFGVTAVPNLHFASIGFGGGEKKEDLTPFFIVGGYGEEDGRLILPLMGEFAHGVNDGYHISLFFEELREQLSRFEP